MGSSKNIDRASALRATWAQNADCVLIYGDVQDDSVGMITLPELAGRETYDDAQHRSLRGLAHALKNPDFVTFPWVLLVDDDSWVNTRELSSFLHGWNPVAPFLCGHIWNHPSGEKHTWPSGGAGMLLTRAAANLLAESLYTPACPFLGFNDVTIGRCLWSLGIALTHSALFHPEADHLNEGSSFRKFNDDGSIRSSLVIHRATPGRMVEFQQVVDRYPEDTVLADMLLG
jgi:hypothetical protein